MCSNESQGVTIKSSKLQMVSHRAQSESEMRQSHVENGGIKEVLLLLLLHNRDGSQLLVLFWRTTVSKHGITVVKIQLTLEHRFELHRSTYMWIIFNKYTVRPSYSLVSHSQIQ